MAQVFLGEKGFWNGSNGLIRIANMDKDHLLNSYRMIVINNWNGNQDFKNKINEFRNEIVKKRYKKDAKLLLKGGFEWMIDYKAGENPRQP